METEIDWTAFTLGEDSLDLADAAREHFTALFTLDDVRTAVAGESSRDLWPTLVEQGYPHIGLPEELDGIGTLLDLASIIEIAGRSLIPAPLMLHAAALRTMLAAGIDLDDPETESTLAARTGGVVRTLGTMNTRRIVTVGEDDETVVRLHAVDAAQVALAASVDGSRPTVEISALGAPIRERRLPVPQDAVLAGARVCAAADLVGVADGALAGAVAHSLAREQFGRPIGAFQAIKHMLADSHVRIERARSLTVGAAVAVDRDPVGAEGARLSRLAKAAASDAAVHSSAVHTQLLGAMGLTYESDAALRVRRARSTAPFLGHARDLYASVAAEAITTKEHRA